MSDDPIKQFLDKKAKGVEPALELIEELLARWEEYGYAKTLLWSIQDFIEKTGTITEGQIQSLENIKRNPSRYGR